MKTGPEQSPVARTRSHSRTDPTRSLAATPGIERLLADALAALTDARTDSAADPTTDAVA
jgi:hypothetical protein